MTTELTASEQSRRNSLEKKIETGMQTFVEVGESLLAIRDESLYMDYGTFEDYCRERWGLSPRTAYDYINTSRVVNNVQHAAQAPTAIRQVLPLAQLAPEQQSIAWQRAVETAPNGKVTGAHVQATVDHLFSETVTESEDEPEVIEKRPKMAKSGFITLSQWNTLGDSEKELAFTPSLGGAQFNSQKNDNIEWARWSWNPVTGCKHDCPYCYARDIANRFYDQKFEPAFLPDRLIAPQNTRIPANAYQDVGYKNVFACSMADLFGRWVPTEWIEAVLDAVRAAPDWNFLFLTKFPIRLSEFEFPDNAWVGTTVDCQIRVKNAENAFRRVKAKVKWLSCEPMLEPLHFADLAMFQWIVIGGASSSSQTPEWQPPRPWIDDLEEQAKLTGCKVYEKSNLWGTNSRLREYPGADTYTNKLPDSLRYLPSIETEVSE